MSQSEQVAPPYACFACNTLPSIVSERHPEPRNLTKLLFCLFRARRLKQLEKENARLKRLVGELHLEKAVLTDVARGNF